VGVGANPLVEKKEDLPGFLLEDSRLEDLPAILEIERNSFSRPWTRASFERELELPFSTTVVVRQEHGAPPIAYACYWVIAGEVQVLNLAVHREQRRQGVGTALVQTLLREGKARGASSVSLEVARENAPAQRLYRSLGFEEVAVRRHYYGRDRDGLLLARPL
jgi:ribosomal-protein-alanine N-acetyltransferase